MIRGACILAVGFALGYGKAVSELPEVRERLESLRKAWCEAQAEDETQDDTVKDESDMPDTNLEGETVSDRRRKEGRGRGR